MKGVSSLENLNPGSSFCGFCFTIVVHVDFPQGSGERMNCLFVCLCSNRLLSNHVYVEIEEFAVFAYNRLKIVYSLLL
jgi:hypothetical protein